MSLLQSNSKTAGKLERALALFNRITMAFGSRDKDNASDEFSHLLSVLEEDPTNTGTRARLEDLHLGAGDQKSAIREYRRAAKHLGAEGLDLESIAIYKKILSLDGFSLNIEALASLQNAEELLIKARRAYEKTIKIQHRENEPQKALEARQRNFPERKGNREKVDIPEKDDSEPVPIEMLLDRSQDLGSRVERFEEHSPEQEDFSSADLPSGGEKVLDWNSKESELPESHDAPFDSPDIGVSRSEIQGAFHEGEADPGTGFSYPQRDLHIDINGIQIDDDIEALLFGDETPQSAENSLMPFAPRRGDDEDIINMLQRHLEDIRTKGNLSV